jgi:protein-S-isoprenylcysteine O-methyltransferase Ste14
MNRKNYIGLIRLSFVIIVLGVIVLLFGLAMPLIAQTAVISPPPGFIISGTSSVGISWILVFLGIIIIFFGAILLMWISGKKK